MTTVTQIKVLSPEYLGDIPKMNRQVLALLIRRAARFAASDARSQGKYEPNWVLYSRPYLDALCAMSPDETNYYADDSLSVMFYCASNLSTWRGPLAKACKARLHTLIKEIQYQGE